ncbi:uncharacterized protein LOC144288551 isoform X2 [Canis aureus]
MVSVELLTENVYCVRALMWNSYKEIKRALYGLNYGLRLNPSHICTFIFRGAIVKSIINENEEFDEHEEHEKVYRICPTDKHFVDVTDFNRPEMADFYDNKPEFSFTKIYFSYVLGKAKQIHTVNAIRARTVPIFLTTDLQRDHSGNSGHSISCLINTLSSRRIRNLVTKQGEGRRLQILKI